MLAQPSLSLNRRCATVVAALPSFKWSLRSLDSTEACGFLVSGNPFGLPVSTQPLAASSIVFVRFGSWMKKFRKLEFEIRKLEFEFRELGFVFRVMDI